MFVYFGLILFLVGVYKYFFKDSYYHEHSSKYGVTSLLCFFIHFVVSNQ